MNKIIISINETHHLSNDKPLYTQRFDKVQSFHFPLGYAPVITEQQAFFINTDGEKVFNREFKEAFGFYDNIATVVNENGFFHIDEKGNDIHSEYFLWSGNFQENVCVVQDLTSKQFFHIDKKGNSIYTEKYAYAGDYRYGIAVVTNTDSLCTHIDIKGRLLHGKYFIELDVYHKGYAIAKDKNGYFHINKSGNQLYIYRYSKLEPFYNGRAVAIDHYGIKTIITINGDIIKRIDSRAIEIKKIECYYSNQAFSYWHSRILNSILELGIFEKFKGGITIEESYKQINLPKKSIDMILRWLVVQQLITTNKNNILLLTLPSEIILCKLKPIIAYWQSNELVSTSLKLADSLKEHKSSFNQLYQHSFFDYIHKNKIKNLESVISYYSVDYSHHSSYLKLSNEIVCDVGGGNGDLLNILKKTYPKITPIILDKFDYKNDNAIKIIKKDFFQKWSIKANIYLISRILHDWNDEQVIEILINIAENMNNKTILYAFETIINEDSATDNGITVSFHLLNILGGRERTLIEFQYLFLKAGLLIKDIYLADSTISLMKVVKK